MSFAQGRGQVVPPLPSHLYAPVYIGYYSGVYGGETAEQNLENHHCFGKSQYIDYLYIHLCFLGPKDLCERVVHQSQIHKFTDSLSNSMTFFCYIYIIQNKGYRTNFVQ